MPIHFCLVLFLSFFSKKWVRTLPFYFYMRGVKPDFKKVATWALSGAIEIFLAGTIPLWTFDIVTTMLWDKAEKKLGKIAPVLEKVEKRI